jgi:uncharacterized protein DUF5946
MSPADTTAEAPGSTPATAGSPAAEGTPETAVCPGCGSVLAVVPGLRDGHPGASASCAALFAVTVRGLREEAAQDARTASLLQLATDAYDAQHLLPGAPATAPVLLCCWLERGQDPLRAAQLADRLADAPRSLTAPARWTTTIADLAADLDVVDLPALVRSWADAVWADWAPAHPGLRVAADHALTS